MFSTAADNQSARVQDRCLGILYLMLEIDFVTMDSVTIDLVTHRFRYSVARDLYSVLLSSHPIGTQCLE